VRRRLADRRTMPRFDIVGDLWGTLEIAVRLSLKNVSSGGALIESSVSIPAGSVHRLTLDCDGQLVTTDVRVQHVRPIPSAEVGPLYQLGVEFVSPHPALVDRINHWLAGGSEVTVSEA
jgi:hypothetical protein